MIFYMFQCHSPNLPQCGLQHRFSQKPSVLTFFEPPILARGIFLPKVHIFTSIFFFLLSVLLLLELLSLPPFCLSQSPFAPCSIVSDPLRPHKYPARLLCPWDFPGKNTGAGCHFLLQGIFLTQDQTHISCLAGEFFTAWASRETYKDKASWWLCKTWSSVGKL